MRIYSHILLATAICLTACVSHKATTSSNNGIVIVFYDTATGKKPLEKAAKKFGSATVYDYHALNGMALSVPRGKTVDEAILYYKNVKGVISANRDETIQLD